MMRNRALGGVMMVIVMCLAGGCATFSRGGKQKVEVVTDPAGAMLVVDGKTYTTPTTVTIKRKKHYDVTLSKPGYQGVHFVLHPRWDAGGAGAVAMDAIIPGGSVLFIVDTLSGADRQFNKIATIKLPPATMPSPPVITLYEFKGALMSQPDYDLAVEQDKMFAKKNKKQPATKPSR